MELNQVAEYCETGWNAYAKAHSIHRDDVFYLLKLQEELGELTRRFLELRRQESVGDAAKLREKFAGDCASIVGNALIMARHFGVDLEAHIRAKFAVRDWKPSDPT
jgi:NTP pyrophosphatase (non-canonical NTP hydrolase)